MKDVGASYGCHNSADGGARSESATLPSIYAYACMTSDSLRGGGSVGVRKIEIGGWAQRQAGPSSLPGTRAKLLIALPVAIDP